LTLAASGSTTLTVNQSIGGLDNAAQGVVQALNAALGTINQETTFSAVSGSGPLLGNVGLEVLRSNLLNALTEQTGVAGSPYTSLSAVGFSITSGGTVTFDDSAFQTAAQTNYAAVASLLGSAGLASNANVSVEAVASTPPGTYAVNVVSNSGGSITGTVNGLAASGAGGLLVVNDSGSSLFGLALQVQPGVTGQLGNVTVTRGLFGSLSSLINAALATGTGSVTGEISSLNTSINSLNAQIAALQKEATQETQLLTAQFSAAQATMSQLTTVSSFLSSFFNQPSGGLGG